jgi:hypothetical protein
VSGLQLSCEEIAKIRIVLHEQNAFAVIHKSNGGLFAILRSSPRTCSAQQPVWIVDTKG